MEKYVLISFIVTSIIVLFRRIKGFIEYDRLAKEYNTTFLCLSEKVKQTDDITLINKFKDLKRKLRKKSIVTICIGLAWFLSLIIGVLIS